MNSMKFVPKLSVPIPPHVIDRYAAKIEKEKSGNLELFLKKFTHAEFTSEEVYANFLRLIRKADLHDDKKLYIKALNIFREQSGLPPNEIEEDIFLVASDKETCIPFSKERLCHLSEYFKTMFNTGLKETHAERIEINLSKEALELFKNYIYRAKLEASNSSFEALKELVDYASMIGDVDLHDKAAQEIINFFLDENNDQFYEEGLLDDCSKEFTKEFLTRKRILFELLPRGSFAIGLSSFISLFSKNGSKILPLVAKEIDLLWIDQNDMAMLCTISVEYRRAIIEIKERPGFICSLHLVEFFERCFPNVSIEMSSERLQEVPALEKNAFFLYKFAYRNLRLYPQNLLQIEQDLRKSIELDQSNPDAFSLLGHVNQLQKKVEEAEEQYKKSLELDPDRVFLPYNYGMSLKERFRNVEAEQFFRKAIEVSPKMSLAYFKLGEILKFQERYNEAETVLRKAVELNPNDLISLKLLAEVLMFYENYDEAASILEKAIPLDNPAYNLQLLLAKIYKAQNKLDDAMAAVQKAPDFFESRILKYKLRKMNKDPSLKDELQIIGLSIEESIIYAKLLKREDNLKNCIAIVKRIIKLSPTYPKAHLLMGSLHLKQNKLTVALKSLRTYIQMTPNDPRGYFRLNSALLQVKRNMKPAKLEAQTVLIKAHLLQGNVLIKKKKFEGAKESFQKAIELDPKNVGAYTCLGEVFFLQEKTEESEGYYTKALQLDPKNEDAYKGLLQIFKQQNRNSEAVECEAVLQEITAAKSLEPQTEPKMEAEAESLQASGKRKAAELDASKKKKKSSTRQQKKRQKGKRKS